MPLSPTNVVLVEAVGADGEVVIGTGYFIEPDRVLTARHVLGPAGSELPGSVAVYRSEPTEEWFEAVPDPVWRVDGVDAVVLATERRNDAFESFEYGSSVGRENVDWDSVAYPAGSARSDRERATARYRSKGLRGTWSQLGGGGQSARHLDLSVADEAIAWHGISGAPVFSGGKLVGIIDTAPPEFENRRLTAIPIERITNNAAFLTATKPMRHPEPEEDDWFLVLHAEQTPPSTAELIGSSLQNLEAKRRDLPSTYDGDIEVASVVVDVVDELVSPDRWLHLVELIVRAPTMIVDVTHHEPAVMMLLGVRAVARRGVTVTVTSETLTESHLKDLPFNIQESRLIPLGDGPASREHLVEAIESGTREMAANPDYLDLPAYDAVRGRPLPDPDGTARPLLVLCPFADGYAPNWGYIQQVVSSKRPLHAAVRMLDIKSPRLVGQALYEQIRWNRHCLVDWTSWRPNVFFEFGVRLACSRDDPIVLIHAAHVAGCSLAPVPELRQHGLLRSLFGPSDYLLKADVEAAEDADPGNPGVGDAFDRQRQRLKGEEGPAVGLPPAATYDAVGANYDWSQERVEQLPHQAVLTEYEARLGGDSQQAVTETQTLFSSNKAFSVALEARSREDLLAAWLYAAGRLGDRARATDGPERAELSRLGEYVLQALQGSKDAFHEEVSERILDLIDAWELDE